jgi:branched-chain amino acid transport system ATP-binding protein
LLQLLEVTSLVAGYGSKETLHNLTLNVQQGEIVSVVGHNGAGKTTLLSAILGVLPVRSGTIEFNGKDVTHCSPVDKIKQGICLVPQGIGVFRDLSVMENLRVVAYLQRKQEYKSLISEAFEFFPALKSSVFQTAGTLSGGQRQMLAVAMSLVARPALMMLDEPTLGLSPIATEEVLRKIKEISESTGCGVLIVEENIYKALSIGRRIYIIKTGEIILEEMADKLLSRPEQFWELF